MRHEVTDADTAAALGSGDVPVPGTGQTTVGTAIRIEHRRATTVGGSVEITATPPCDAASRRLTFDVQANDGSGQIIAAGEIDRVIVDRDRFLEAASDPHAGH